MLTSLTRRYFRVVFFSKIRYQSAPTVFPSLTTHPKLCSLARAKLLSIYWKPMLTCCLFLMCVSDTRLSAVSRSRAPAGFFYLRAICVDALVQLRLVKQFCCCLTLLLHSGTSVTVIVIICCINACYSHHNIHSLYFRNPRS